MKKNKKKSSTLFVALGFIGVFLSLLTSIILATCSNL